MNFVRKGGEGLETGEEGWGSEGFAEITTDFDARGTGKRLMSLALDVAEQRLLDGTASSQLVTTILKISTEREKLEREILEKKRDLLVAQKESIESSKRIEELYAEAIEAMKRYSVRDGSEDEEYEEL